MLLLMGLLLAAAPADDLARARVLYQSGKTHYELHDYEQAIRDFAAGYALVPKPEFLVNLGQAWRAAGNLEKAADMFSKYLERAPADAPPRAEVEGLLAEVRAALAARADDVPRRPALEPVVTPAAPQVAPPPASERPAWVIPTVIAAVVAGVGAAVAIGVVAGTGGCAPARTLGCVDLRTP